MLITGFAFLLGIGGLCAQETTAQRTGEPQATIREISGTVEIKAPGAADWAPASRGQVVEQRALISTGFKSSVLLAIGNSTLSVQPLTRLSLEELVLAGNSEKVDVNLRAGRVRANVRPPAGGTTGFTVRSPTATASVRGTVFEFNGTELRVDEGRVHLSSSTSGGGGGGGGNGAYVGVGHVGRMDTETGRAAGAAETAREALAPAMPAGADSAPEAPAAVPTAGDINAGFDWL
jgi:ferric-dicitrate binding protein FerR (iron transport regulator)